MNALGTAASRLYVYAVVPAFTALPPGDLRTVRSGELAAVVGPLSAAMLALGGDTVVEELGPAAEEHERVVERLLDLAPAVVPLRFGTVAPDEAAVYRLLEEAADALRDGLRVAEGRVEWSVQLFVHGPVASGSRADVEDGSLPAGRAYLAAKRRVAEERASAAEHLVETISSIHDALAGSSVAASCSPLFDRLRAAATADGRVLVSRGVYLADRAAEGRFLRRLESAVARLGEGFVEAEVTGPWPAYHFVGARGGEAAPAGGGEDR